MIPLSSVSYRNDRRKELLLVISRDKIIRCAMRFDEILVLIPRIPKKTGKKKDAYTLKAVNNTTKKYQRQQQQPDCPLQATLIWSNPLQQ